jgi:hypothetical protein
MKFVLSEDAWRAVPEDLMFLINYCNYTECFEKSIMVKLCNLLFYVLKFTEVSNHNKSSIQEKPTQASI